MESKNESNTNKNIYINPSLTNEDKFTLFPTADHKNPKSYNNLHNTQYQNEHVEKYKPNSIFGNDNIFNPLSIQLENFETLNLENSSNSNFDNHKKENLLFSNQKNFPEKISENSFPENFDNSSNKPNENFKIDKHLDKIGYSFFHLKMIFIVSLIFFVDGCEMSNVNMLLSSIQNDLDLNNFQKSSLSSSIFIGFFIGSFLSGFTTNKFGRLKPIKYGIFFLFIFSFIMSISRSISQLIIMRILTGLAIGQVVPACKTLVTECIPSHNRSFVLSIIWLFYPFGTVYICVLALNFPTGKDFNWRKVFLIHSLTSFVLVILTQFLTESPRFLLKNGKSDEAIELLDFIGSNNKGNDKVYLNENEKNMIYMESHQMNDFNIEENLDSQHNLSSNPDANSDRKFSSDEKSTNNTGI